MSAKINVLLWNLTHRLWLTGGDGPGEKATVEAQRELSRLKAGIESELASASEHAAAAGDNHVSGSAPSLHMHARLLPIHSSAPLSQFEATVGKLMVEARRMCPTKYLPEADILKIAALLDDKDVPVRKNLERAASRSMAEYNQKHPTAAIKSWKTALGHRQFLRSVRKRFSRAEEKYKKAPVAGPSAGTPRTTF